MKKTCFTFALKYEETFSPIFLIKIFRPQFKDKRSWSENFSRQCGEERKTERLKIEIR